MTFKIRPRVALASLVAAAAAAAALLAVPGAAAECAPFCAQVEPDARAEVTRCDACGDDPAAAFDETRAACEEDGEVCCEDWCRWVPSATRPVVALCEGCEEEDFPRGVGCASWCGFVPEAVHGVVPPCARCGGGDDDYDDDDGALK